MRDILGTAFICESVSPDDNIVKNLNVVDKNGLFYAEFDTHLQRFKTINRNQRGYIGSNVWENIERSPKIQALLADDSWFGEENHPAPEIAGQKLSNQRLGEVKMSNTSHKIRRPRMIGDDYLDATIVTDPATDAGRNMAIKMAMGMIPNFSSRAFGDLVNIGGRPTIMVKKLVTYDWVFYPSHPEAKRISGTKYSNINVPINESSFDTQPDDVYVNIHDLVECVANTDDNTKIILESFGLDMTDLLGFTKDRKHIAIRDENNILYSQISMENSKKVRGYLSSLSKGGF